MSDMASGSEPADAEETGLDAGTSRHILRLDIGASRISSLLHDLTDDGFAEQHNVPLLGKCSR